MDLTLQRNGVQGFVNPSTAERKAGSGRLHAAEVPRDAIYYDVITARRGENRMEVALIKLPTKVNDYLGASNLCRSKIRSAVDSRIRAFTSTLNEAHCEKVTSLRGNKDRKVNSALVTVHG